MSCRPSTLLALTEPLLAWAFDEAVATFGRWVDARLSEKVPIKRKGRVVGHKPKWQLEQLLIGQDTGVKPSIAHMRARFGRPDNADELEQGVSNVTPEPAITQGTQP